jgi:hypothetical protein
MVADQNLEIQRGDDERLKAVITPASAATALYFMAKKKFSQADADAVISKSLGAGISITVAGDSNTPAEAQIVINKADTQVLPNKETPPVVLFYNLTDGDNHTLAKGKLTVKPEVRLAG